MFEKLLSKLITVFIDPSLSKYQRGYTKGFSAQHCLLAMLEKSKNAVDKGKVFGALLTSLSKAFDCLSRELIIPKLNAYGFNPPALKLMHSYLSHRKQRTKVNHAYSPILGSVLFNIFSSDLLLVISDTDFSSYADDNTIYDPGKSIDEVISSLQESAEKFFQWFSHNQLKGNTDKCHLIFSTDDPIEISVGVSLIKSSTRERSLGVIIDNKLNFDTHVYGLSKKANNKLRALARATPYLSLEKKKLLINSFFNAQFNYCPLIWMLHSGSNNSKIKHLHERCLRLIYNDKQSSYESL